MRLVRENDDIVLMANNDEIERYNFSQEINFRKFIEYLLSFNLSAKIEINDEVEAKSEHEENLIKLINDIKDDYNAKVEELEKFKKENEKDNVKGI